MYQLSDFKKGLKILVDGQPYSVIDFQHVKPGKGNQFTRCKLKNLLTGNNVEKTYRSGEKFEVPDVHTQDTTFLYHDDNGFHFMNQSNYEQIALSREDLGDKANYLVENLQVTILFFNGRAIDLDLPNSVALKITYCEPGIKGNTATNATKPATLESGATVQVPLHINDGDTIKVNTETGAYVERVNS